MPPKCTKKIVNCQEPGCSHSQKICKIYKNQSNLWEIYQIYKNQSNLWEIYQICKNQSNLWEIKIVNCKL